MAPEERLGQQRRRRPRRAVAQHGPRLAPGSPRRASGQDEVGPAAARGRGPRSTAASHDRCRLAATAASAPPPGAMGKGLQRCTIHSTGWPIQNTHRVGPTFFEPAGGARIPRSPRRSAAVTPRQRRSRPRGRRRGATAPRPPATSTTPARGAMPAQRSTRLRRPDMSARPAPSRRRAPRRDPCRSGPPPRRRTAIWTATVTSARPPAGGWRQGAGAAARPKAAERADRETDDVRPGAPAQRAASPGVRHPDHPSSR